MSATEKSGLCLEVEESLGEILDGAAAARLYDHIAECDACRDLKHEASLAARAVGAAGADFRPGDDFVERLVGRLEAARPVDPVPRSGPGGLGGKLGLPSGPPNVDEVASSADTAAVSRPPVSGAKSEAQATEASITQPSAKTPRVPLTEVREETSAPAPVKATIAEEPSPEALGVEPSGVAATTHHGPATDPAAPAGKTEVAEAAPASPARPAAFASEPPRKVVPETPRAKARARVAPLRRPSVIAGVAALAMAAAATVGFYVKGRGPSPVETSGPAPWSGTVAKVTRASADKAGGLEVCDAKGACAPAEGGAAIRAGSTLRTDARTRAHLTLADGTALAIDRATEVELAAKTDRAARIKRGTVVADVAHVEGSSAHFAFAKGDVEVLGTKLAITAGDDRASIEVARGAVRVRSDAGRTVDVRAGEEATIVGSAEPVVASSTSLADVMEWSDQKSEDIEGPTLRGLGELRARRPGQTKEKDHAVRLARHATKVRIVDVVARTEIDETFTNDTDEELEGIFRFPLPPGAQIERLALEVNGKLEDGAFVERDRGAAIWRGVIQNAAPKAPKPKEEIIWVPGPWRDPALLEWQRGGRFELKIFPIPKRGSRRVVLAYTQVVDQAAGMRRFTYPLPHDPSGTTRVGSFDLDLQVLGADKSLGIQSRGYELLSASGDGERRSMHADNFVPAGDLTVEYALPDRDKEVTAWAYSAPAESFAPVASTPAKKAKSAEEKAAAEAAQAIAADGSPFVAIALRPKLPRYQEAKERLNVIVVDASRSMVGERFSRARSLAAAVVREMDRRDSFLLLACDTVCRPLAARGGGPTEPMTPGAAAAADVEKFLGSIEPDGGSDLAAAMSAARSAAGPLGGRELRVIYLGDGTPSVGPTRPAHIEAAVRSKIPPGDGQVVAVALGADADTTSLQALARGGGGVVVPYVPGQKVASAAIDVLGAAYGLALRDPVVELPPGLTQVTPAHLDPIRAGGETLVVARMTGSEVSGDVKIKGRVGGEAFERSYPLKVAATTNAGNAFVPRLFAAAKIAELERIGGDAQKATVIELSKRFAVASRFTSLLVLESEAMFKAFGLERSSAAPAFTGEQQAESSTADPDVPAEPEAEAKGDSAPRAAASAAPEAKGKKGALRGFDDEASMAEGLGAGNGFGSSTGRLGGGSISRAPAAAPQAMGKPGDFAAPATPPPSPAKVAGPARPSSNTGACGCPPGDLMCAMECRGGGEQRAQRDRWRRPPPPRTRMIPMRRVFDRKVAFEAQNALQTQNVARLAAAESALAGSPDSRDRTVELFALYATSGRLGEAQELTAKWSGRDALDPDALVARADLAARQGDRDRAVRILGGLADVRPADRAVQIRLADLHDAAGNAALACEHRVALADLAPGDAKLVADAVRCSRAQGMLDLASALTVDAGEKVREAVDKLLAGPPPAAPRALGGDVQLSAEWTGGADLDLAIIDAQGKRTSWLGSAGKATVTARDVTSLRGESLAIANLPQGSYVVEIARAAGGDVGDPIRGEVTLRLGGEVRRVPFLLTGARAEIGTVKVSFTSRLVPVEIPF